MKLVKTIGTFLTKHERVILTCITIGAEAAAIYAALKEGPKFKEIAKKVEDEELDKTEAAKELALPAVKIAVPFVISGGAAILNHKKASDTIASLANMANLYSATKAAADEYKAQTEKEVGEEVAEKIEQNTTRAMYEKDSVSGRIHPHVYQTGNGDVKFYDDYSKRYFLSDANYIQSVVNDLNMGLIEAWENDENHVVSLNDLYDELGLPRVDAFDNFVWDHDTGIIRYNVTPVTGDDNQFYGIFKFAPHSEPRNVRWGY